MNQRPAILGVFAVVLAAILWGSTGTLQAQMPAERIPVVVGVVRLVIGAIALCVLALAIGARPRTLVQLPLGGVILAGCAIGLYNLLFFRGVALAGVGVGTAITIGSAPLWVIGYEILRGIIPTRAKAFGLGLCLVGVVLLAGLSADVRPDPLGVLLGLGAGASYAFYSQATSAIKTDLDSSAIAAATFSVAALVTAPALFLYDTAWIWQAQALWPLLGLGVLSTGVAYALYTWGLRHVLPSTAVTLALVEPMTAFFLAVFLLGESVTLPTGVGAGLLLVGLMLVTRAEARRKA